MNPFSAPLHSVVVKAEWNSSADSAGLGLYKGYFLSGLSLEEVVILNVTYYDNYSFLGKNDFPPSTDIRVAYEQDAEIAGFGKRYIDSTKGLVTGILTAQLAGDTPISSYLYSVMYYDNRSRVIQSKSNNHLGEGVEKEYIGYNFTGQPIKRKHIHSVVGNITQTELYTYTYDHAGRLLTTKHQLNNGISITLVNNEYDELGRLKCNKRNGRPSLQTDYTYNIRSWTKSNSSPLFNQTLYYDDSRPGDTNVPYYNGNISGMDWKVANDKYRGYDFSYDDFSRLTSADYLENNTRSDKFTTSYSYDKHGNILSLRRSGNQGVTMYGEIDSLMLSYHGNQLIRVEDTAPTPTLSMSMDFMDGVSQEIEYSYDANGNQTKDLNKGITGIEYNFLNLPKRIKFSGANNPKNEYVYSVAGKKLSVIHKSTTEKRTDYVGNMIYENGSLKRILVDGGYIENGIYHFYLQDHLGNNRVVAKSDGTVVQTTHYYPYGMSFAEGTFADKQPYKYNDKELDTENGLNLYDYDARQMDVIFGRFTSVDPMAEKYYSVSLYVYCSNNPINQIDPDGRDGIYIAFPDYKISTPLGKIGNLGHAVLLLINNKTGGTKYYEYGRYDAENKGIVRTISVPDVKIGKDGQPTIESLNRTMKAISEKAGQGGRIEGAYINSSEFKEMKSYAESKMAENSNPKRKKYGLTGNNCGTFAADVLVQDSEVKKKAPIIIDPRPKSIVEEYRDKFKPISYDPEKNKQHLNNYEELYLNFRTY